MANPRRRDVNHGTTHTAAIPQAAPIIIDEQARIHALHLDATTEVWTPCTSAHFVERITLRGSPSMQEIVLGRGPDEAGLTMFYEPRRKVFKIVDAKATNVRDRVQRIEGTNVKQYTLKMDEPQPEPSPEA
jgi:hypothetical protein